MKSFLVIEDFEGLNFAILHGMEFAFPVENKEISAAVDNLLKEYHYNGGALISIDGNFYQGMYHD